MVWENALEHMQPSLKEKGYFHCAKSFKDFVKEHKIQANLLTPIYLSLDFYSQQRPELTNRDLYVIRLGQGSFGIFDQRVYPKPYLELSKDNTEQISFEIPSE